MQAVCSGGLSNLGEGNIKSAGVIEMAGTIYAAVQCMTYNDQEDKDFGGRQVKLEGVHENLNRCYYS